MIIIISNNKTKTAHNKTQKQKFKKIKKFHADRWCIRTFYSTNYANHYSFTQKIASRQGETKNALCVPYLYFL